MQLGRLRVMTSSANMSGTRIGATVVVGGGHLGGCKVGELGKCARTTSFNNLVSKSLGGGGHVRESKLENIANGPP